MEIDERNIGSSEAERCSKSSIRSGGFGIAAGFAGCRNIIFVVKGTPVLFPIIA